MAKQDAEWTTINVDTLGDSIRSDWDSYKVAYRMAKEAREAFEEAMAKVAKLPQGKRMIFGYNFGKLSVAIVDDDRKPGKAKAGGLTLAQFIASQQNSGAAH